MALRLAFDLDGVLADMDKALGARVAELFGIEEPTLPVPVPDGVPEPEGLPPSEGSSVPETTPAVAGRANGVLLSVRQRNTLWRAVRGTTNFWETLDEIEPGAVARLGRVARERSWEVIFLTQRPETTGATAQLQTQRWLERYGFPLPSVFVVRAGSRGRIAAALDLDAFVDDRPENCLDVATGSRARAILIWRPGQGPVPVGTARLEIDVVSSVHACLDVLESIGGPGDEPHGMVERIKRAVWALATAGSERQGSK